MPLLQSLSVRNLRCFREQIDISLATSTYLTGANNSGKTAILTALKCFFDTTAFTKEFLNKTEFVAKKDGFNRTDITITFDLSVMTGQKRKARMMTAYGPTVAIKKTFTFRVISSTVTVQYAVGNGPLSDFDELHKDIQEMLNGVSISYIHPQEGSELLENAQRKFKARLFNNWGRHASVAEKLKGLQTQWAELRKIANTYLSSALTENLQKMWTNSQTSVDLPENIEDIVAVSDITFRGGPSMPDISLVGQGTGAQSTILYQTHYLLDSDRSLHRGLYFPIWLLEEPESFLHADIAAKLGDLLNSDEWLANIQMVISTHSPIILAASRKNAAMTRWVIVSNHAVELQKSTANVDNSEIQRVSALMGDSNFDAYFSAAQSSDLIVIEDERPLTKQRLVDAGIQITNALHGTSELKKFLNVFCTVPHVVRKRAFFLIDRDKGAQEFSTHCVAGKLVKSHGGFSLYKCADNIFIILLPENTAMEGLFDEFEDFLDECIGKLFKTDWSFADAIPIGLTRAVAGLRRKAKPISKKDARELIQNEQDIKDGFWAKVDSANYQLSTKAKNSIHALLK